MNLRSLTAMLLCLAQTAWADVPARLETAFLGWAKDVGASEAVMSVREAGRLVSDVTLGMAADTVVETASLSKAITAVCAARMVEQAMWTVDTTSHAVLGYGAKGITLAQLLTHTSGLSPDQTQTRMFRWLDRDIDRIEAVSKTALGRVGRGVQAGSYFYNNENYAVIGAMIAARTGQSYRDACAARVLVPAGVRTGRPSQRSGAFLPWGGWEMSVQDYGAFHWHAFGPGGIIGADPTQWPSVSFEGGAQYGMGTFQRAMAGSHNYWHFGALCFIGRLNIGSYAVIWLDGYSIVAAYDVCPTWEQMGALDAALVKAVFE